MARNPLRRRLGTFGRPKRFSFMAKLIERSSLPHEYRIVWNAARQIFSVTFDNLATDIYTLDKATAIAVAVSLARTEATMRGIKCAVSSTMNGARLIEWDDEYATHYLTPELY